MKNPFYKNKLFAPIIVIVILLIVILLIKSDIFSKNSVSYDSMKVYSFLKEEPSLEDVKIMEKNLQSGDCGLRKLSTLVLFNLDKNSYKKDLFEEFFIEGLEMRNYMSILETTQIIESIEQKYPDYQAFLILPYVFCEVQNSNIWVQTEEGDINFAKFIRGSIFGAYFKSEKEALNIINEIDNSN